MWEGCPAPKPPLRRWIFRTVITAIIITTTIGITGIIAIITTGIADQTQSFPNYVCAILREWRRRVVSGE